MQNHFTIITKTQQTFYFVGVTTHQSSIMKVFPRWMDALGRSDVLIEGVDLKIDDNRNAYRQATAQIKYDPLSLGALVTTHKISILKAARDLFDDLDEYARLCGEISSISKLGDRLQGHAKDPISAGKSLDAILGPGYFGCLEQQGEAGSVLIFGAGGSATATLLHLLLKKDPADRPEAVILVDRLPERLEQVREMVEKVDAAFPVHLVCNSEPLENNRLMMNLPQGSVVINATGMGKDIPGSPITDGGVFPYQGIAWEFNYRGELDFMHQALAQAGSRQLRIEDGWLYFLHGWTQVIAQVLHIDMTAERFNLLKEIAEDHRSKLNR